MPVRNYGPPVLPAIATALAQSHVEGDIVGLSTDLNGNLRTTGGGGGGGGTSSTDETPFSVGSSAGTPMMGVITPSDNPPSGDLAVVALAADRSMKISGSFSASPATSSTSSTVAQTTVGTSAVQALAANSGRKGFSIQNQGTTVLKILLGSATPTQANYTVALPPGGTANDGSSHPWYGPPGFTWTGAIQWISSGAGGLGEAVEFT